MNVPVVFVGDLMINEFPTAATDLMVAMICLWCGWLLVRRRSLNAATSFWALFFFGMSTSTLTGALGHGFNYVFGDSMLVFSWTIGGSAVFLAQTATAVSLPSGRLRTVLRWEAFVQLLAFLVLILLFRSFVWVKIQAAVGLGGAVMLTQVYLRSRGHDGARYIVWGLLLSMTTPIIHGLEFSAHRWFNQNDLSHTILAVCFYLVFLGARGVAEPAPIQEAVTDTGLGGVPPPRVA